MSQSVTSSVVSNKPRKETHVGISFTNSQDGSVEVSKVAEDGLAEQSELKVGHTVEEINGIPMTGKQSWVGAVTIRNSKGDANITTTSFNEEVCSDVEAGGAEANDESAGGAKDDVNEAANASLGLGITIAAIQVVSHTGSAPILIMEQLKTLQH